MGTPPIHHEGAVWVETWQDEGAVGMGTIIHHEGGWGHDKMRGYIADA